MSREQVVAMLPKICSAIDSAVRGVVKEPVGFAVFVFMEHSMEFISTEPDFAVGEQIEIWARARLNGEYGMEVKEDVPKSHRVVAAAARDVADFVCDVLRDVPKVQGFCLMFFTAIRPACFVMVSPLLSDVVVPEMKALGASLRMPGATSLGGPSFGTAVVH